MRVLERKDARSLRIETDERSVISLGRAKSFNFSLESRPLTDADWARYQQLAKK